MNFLAEANFGGVFPKNRRLPAKPRINNKFRNSTIADRGDRMGTLLGTLRNRFEKPAARYQASEAESNRSYRHARLPGLR